MGENICLCYFGVRIVFPQFYLFADRFETNLKCWLSVFFFSNTQEAVYHYIIEEEKGEKDPKCWLSVVGNYMRTDNKAPCKQLEFPCDLQLA
jgi:hypothetical protein